MTAPTMRSPARQRGMGIVETMVGILIGMVVVLAIYNVFALVEGYKRTTVGVADAQTTGLVAQFLLAREIGNAGNGMAIDAANLATCTVPDAKWLDFAGAGSIIRPIPVMINDGTSAARSDQLMVTYSTPSRVVNSVLMDDKSVTAPGDTVYVQSPNGFSNGNWIIVYDRNGKCELTRVVGIALGDHLGDPNTGYVGLTTDPLMPLTPPYTIGGVDGPRVLNLGCDGKTPPNCDQRSSVATRMLIDVGPDVGPCSPSKNCQLRTKDLFANVPASVPIAQNVVLLKAQYGVDCLGNGVITWTSAIAGGACGFDYTPGGMMLAPPWTAANLARIRAVRIAIIVRSDEPDLKDPALVGQTATLFDCSTHDAACQGAIAIPSTVLIDGWRYRTYETIVPMRNAIYNNGT